MRTIREIIIHCSATPEGRDVRAAEIRRWHTLPKPKGNGWADIGYHFVIDLDGTVEPGRPVDQAGAHCKGRNSHSIGICYVGGVDKNLKPKDTRTEAQRQAMLALVKQLLQRYPGAEIHGHNEYDSRPCPSFDVQQWRKEVQL